MRHCPTLQGDDLPLIAHVIAESVCQTRQRDLYHKCHRCVYRGRPADFVPETGSGLGRNGAVRKAEPRPDEEPVAAVARTEPAAAVEDSGSDSEKGRGKGRGRGTRKRKAKGKRKRKAKAKVTQGRRA